MGARSSGLGGTNATVVEVDSSAGRMEFSRLHGLGPYRDETSGSNAMDCWCSPGRVLVRDIADWLWSSAKEAEEICQRGTGQMAGQIAGTRGQTEAETGRFQLSPQLRRHATPVGPSTHPAGVILYSKDSECGHLR
jgi:hypothetical protein